MLAIAVFAAGAAIAPAVEADAVPGPRADEPWDVQVGPEAQVIVDDYLRGATADEAAEGLRFCESIPGCQAFWQPGAGTIVVLRPRPVDPGGVESTAPPSSQ